MLNFRRLTKGKNAWVGPFFLLIILSVAHYLFLHYSASLEKLFLFTPLIYPIENCLHISLMAFFIYWLGAWLISGIHNYLQKTSLFQKEVSLTIISPFVSSVLKALLLLFLFSMGTKELKLMDEMPNLASKLTGILVICVITWTLIQLIKVAEQLMMHRYKAKITGSIIERKIYTQTSILKRVAYLLISVLSAGSILVLFENVRALGASILTTAGLVGLILTFAAQRSLSSIFSGLEVALTQLIKIGDLVVIDGERGTIEEINFRTVIVKLWDWRRLIVPTSHFLEKSFQNWSRVQKSNLIGTVYLYVDFTLPVPEIRNKLQSILKNCPLWDENIGTIKINELQEQVMQLIVLASARNPDDLSNLRAHIREKLIEFIVKNYPNALPKTRSFAFTEKNYKATEILSKEKVFEEL